MPKHYHSRPPVFYPKHLTTYRDCPERYFHAFVERRRVEDQFSPALAKGSAVHAVLAACFREFQLRGGFPDNLRERVATQLPRESYPTEFAWTADVEEVLTQVNWAICQFYRNARVLAVEETFEYWHPGMPDCPRFVLRAKVDLVLYHEDAGLEHLDFKTGRSYFVDQIQNVASRIVVRASLHDEYAYIRSSTAFLAMEATRSDNLTREHVQETWREIKSLVTAIMADQQWRPVRSPRCEWCPFFGNGCSLDPTLEQSDDLREWLEGAAD